MELHRLTSPENRLENPNGSAAKRKKIDTTCYSLSSDGSVHNSESPCNAQLKVSNSPSGAQSEGSHSPSITHSIVADSEVPDRIQGEENEIDVDSASSIVTD